MALAHPHFGLSLRFGLHSQGVLEPHRQPDVLAGKERGRAGV